MNFIDYIIKCTDKYTKFSLPESIDKQMAITLQVLNYRARCMREKFNKEYDYLLEIDTEKDPGYFDRITKEPNKEN